MDEVIKTSTDASLPSYCHRYGWAADPFSHHADKAPYFIPAWWDQYLDVVQHVYQNENTLIAIIGPGGSGKTTFLKQILLQIDSNTLTCLLDANQSLTTESVISSMVTEFQLTVPPGDSIEEKLDSLLNATQFNPQSCLLIIDNAHGLSIEIIQNILYCIEQQTDYQMRLHIIVLGNATLKQLLDTASFSRTKQIVIRNLALQKFNQQDTAHYLKHRINTIGQRDQLPFDVDSIKYIQVESTGYPQQINIQAKQVLLNGVRVATKTKQNPKKISAYINKPSIIAVGMIIAIIFTASLKIPHSSTTLKSAINNPSSLVSTTSKVIAASSAENNVTTHSAQANTLNPDSTVPGNKPIKLSLSQLDSINNLDLLNTPVVGKETQVNNQKSSTAKTKKSKNKKNIEAQNNNP